MGREVVMDEQLSVHQEEWDVVHSPNDEEEPCVVPQPVAHSYKGDTALALGIGWE